MQNVTFNDTIINNTDDAHTNLEKMFSPIIRGKYIWNGEFLKDDSMNAGQGIKEDWQVVLHLVGLIALNVIALVAFVILCVMRSNLKALEASTIPKNAEAVKGFDYLCGFINEKLTPEALADENQLIVAAGASSGNNLVENFKLVDFSAGFDTSKLNSLKEMMEEDSVSTETLLIFIKTLCEKSGYSAAIKHFEGLSQTPNLKALKDKLNSTGNTVL